MAEMRAVEGTAVFVFVLALGLVSHGSAHVYMKSPVPRQVLDPQEYNKASHDGRRPDLPGSICGDGGRSSTFQFGHRARFGIPRENYLVAGQKLEIKTWVMAGHQGRYEYYLCQYSGAETATTVNQACFNKHVLKPVEGQEMVTYPYNYYWLGTVPTGEVSMWYYVPSDVNCDGKTTFCILQFNYWSGNNCNPPGYCPTNVAKTKCSPYFPECGPRAELYRNCADVVISGGVGGGRAPVVNSNPTRRVVPPPKNAGSRDTCCAGKPDGLHRNPSSCRLVCKCSGGKTIQRLSCRVGFNFDNIRKKCRSSAIFKC